MKKNAVYLIILLFVSCQQNTSKKSEQTKQDDFDWPTEVDYKDYENINLTILKAVKKNPYNESGYVILMPEKDKYGYTDWNMSMPIYEFDPSVVSEIKKYKSVYDFSYTSDGKWVIQQLLDCRKDVDTTNPVCEIYFPG